VQPVGVSGRRPAMGAERPVGDLSRRPVGSAID
jgi:hypothetical protein